MTRKFLHLRMGSGPMKWLACLMVFTLLIVSTLILAPFSRVTAATSATVTVSPGQNSGSLTSLSKGLNTAVWDGHLLDSASISAVQNAGINVLRYPGGSTSDVYHWQSNTTVPGQSSTNVNDTFDAFMGVTQSVGAQAMITVNYGSGTAQEAAGWVQYANKGGTGYNGPVPSYSGGSSSGHTYGVKYWEIGNEIYGNGTYGSAWEYETHPLGPSTYANNVVSYSQAMKAVDPTINIGVVLTAPGNWPDGQTSSTSPQPWNPTVLTTACSSIDFVIVHWYAQGPMGETDASLLAAPQNGENTSVSSTPGIPGMVSTLRSQINAYCGSHASAVQIMVTETNSVSYNPGKQTVSLVNSLFLADNYMTWLENGVANVDWWDLHNSPVGGTNNSSSLYGNAQYGDYGVLSTGGCTTTTSGICEPAANTPFPPYYGLQMLNYLAKPGDVMVPSSSNQSLVASHAVRQADGKLAVMLVNKDPNNSYTISFASSGYFFGPNATIYTYGQTSSSITSTTASSSGITIAPYSLTTVILQLAVIDPTPPVTPTTVVTPTPTPGITPTPTIGVTPTPTMGVTPTPTTSGTTCQVTYAIISQWPGGFGVNLTIKNTGTTAINGWSLRFTFSAGQTITQLWNGSYTQSGGAVTITNLSYNGSLPAGATLNSSPGFNGSWNGSNPKPTTITLNGTACSVL